MITCAADFMATYDDYLPRYTKEGAPYLLDEFRSDSGAELIFDDHTATITDSGVTISVCDEDGKFHEKDFSFPFSIYDYICAVEDLIEECIKEVDT